MIDFPIIDSHIHLLDQKRFGYGWASGAPALNRNWTPDDLTSAAKPYVIEGLVFVEVDVDMPQYLDEADFGLTASPSATVACSAPSSACRWSEGWQSSRRWRGSRNSRRCAACAASSKTRWTRNMC